MAFLTQDAQVNCNARIDQAVSPVLSRSTAKEHPRTHPTSPPPMIIELADGICAKTAIPVANHSAVRSGFAGHPVNPRWTATKVMAWKTGRAWRQGLAAGTLVVRAKDALLVPAKDRSEAIGDSRVQKPQGFFCFLPLKWFPQSEVQHHEQN